MDNFFSSIKLFQYSIDNHTDCLRTLKANREGVPLRIREAKLYKNKHVIVYKTITLIVILNKLSIKKFSGKKVVYFFGSTHDDEARSRGKDFLKHYLVLNKIEKMGDIDLSDSMMTLNKLSRNKNHYISQFRHLLDVICLNSFIIKRKDKEK